MSDVAANVEAEVFKVLQAVTTPLESLGEAELGPALGVVAKGIMSLPPVQAFVAKEEEALASAAGALAGRVSTSLSGLIDSEAKAHPALAALWAKVAPAVEAAAKPLVQGLADDVAAKIVKYQSGGQLGAILLAGEKALGLVS